jgi:guanylate kinase
LAAARSGLLRMREPSFVVVLSGPAGVGKSTCWRRLSGLMPEIEYSISTTTRPMRDGERDGVSYRFVSEAEFDRLVEADAFLEWAHVHGYRYGTPAEFVRRSLDAGRIVFLEVDVQGGEKLLDAFPDGVYIFLLPPRFEVLEERLRGRGTEDEDAISRRLKRARDEMALANVDRYCYQVVNDDLDAAVDKLRSIIVAESCRLSRRRALEGR